MKNLASGDKAEGEPRFIRVDSVTCLCAICLLLFNMYKVQTPTPPPPPKLLQSRSTK